MRFRKRACYNSQSATHFLVSCLIELHERRRVAVRDAAVYDDVVADEGLDGPVPVGHEVGELGDGERRGDGGQQRPFPPRGTADALVVPRVVPRDPEAQRSRPRIPKMLGKKLMWAVVQ